MTDMNSVDELLVLSSALKDVVKEGERDTVIQPLNRLQQSAEKVGEAWSGSCIGYHANVYYAHLDRPPPGAHFSKEWGIEPRYGGFGSKGDWREYDPADLEQKIMSDAQSPDLSVGEQAAMASEAAFTDSRERVLSILETEIAARPDSYLSRLREKVEALPAPSKSEVLRKMAPEREQMSRDTVAVYQGLRVPPHIEVLARVLHLRSATMSCADLSTIAQQAASHIERSRRNARREARIGTNVFIGHGRSSEWRKLKDFVNDRLGLPWDEFNRVPSAGVTNIDRLSEMLDAAAFAFLVMTAEDDQADGSQHARQNVVHEAGLFQGRLGFTRAVVLLEAGCEPFSNIDGLGQIRFPANRIQSAFEEVRLVLEREGLIDPGE